jgi:hypothetical protein
MTVIERRAAKDDGRCLSDRYSVVETVRIKGVKRNKNLKFTVCRHS